MDTGLDGADNHVRKAPRRGVTSAARRRRFFLHLSATCNAAASAKAAGLSNSTVYALRQADAEFLAAWQDAMRAGYDRLEEALLARALAALQQGEGAADTPPSEDAPPAGRGGGRPAHRLDGKVALSAVQLALDLLNRRQAAEKRGTAGRRRASTQEVEAALGAKLDSLARRIGEPER